MIFGALGDLALRKLFPALYQLERAGLLSEGVRILALANRPGSQAECIGYLVDQFRQFVTDLDVDPELLARLIDRVGFHSMDFASESGYPELAKRLTTQEQLIAYFATPAALYEAMCFGLAKVGLADRTRVVLEKPIGHDLPSSRAVNDAVARFFPESRIYRIDHYLGKETVQNLIALRFANSLFETQWNQNFISHVEITVAEQVGIEGRWGYFDQAGQLRDMVQNHLLQLLCLIAMDPPAELSADSIRDEKVKVLKALVPITASDLGNHVVRGQYVEGRVKGQGVPGYLDEPNANLQSDTETFVALRVEVRNWRWAGMPFYLRTGKRMSEKLTQIVIHFKAPPHYIFTAAQRRLVGNKLVIRLQPNESIALHVMTKEQGLDKGMQLRGGPLQLNFAAAHGHARIPDAYERLLLEVMRGNQNLFVRKDEIEHAWKWCDQLIAGWKLQGERPKPYPAGSWGPLSSVALTARDDKSWYEDV